MYLSPVEIFSGAFAVNNSKALATCFVIRIALVCGTITVAAAQTSDGDNSYD